MQRNPTRSQARSSPIVRAAAFEVAVPKVAETDAPAPTQVAKDIPAVRELLTALKRQIDELRSRQRQSVTDIAALTVELGVALAERLLHAEIAANRQRLDRVVLHALERLPVGSKVVVHGHPDDLAILEQQLAQPGESETENSLIPKVEMGNDVTLRPDAAMHRGNLRLEGGDFFISWDTAMGLKELRAALIEETFKDL